MYDDIFDKNTVSLYQPSREVIELTKTVKDDYFVGQGILERQWPELNNYSVIERTNKDQRTFNALVDESTEDPAEAWKWRGTRSTARKKALAMHAQLTANYLIPGISAQNESDEEDREMSEAMRTIIEWMVEPTTSNYQPSFLLATMGMLVNPVTYLSADYAQVMQTIKPRDENGNITRKEIVDEVLSGFQANVFGPSEILITNAYVQQIQRQPRIIRRRYIDYSEAEAKYGRHENWGNVQKGVRSVLNEADGLFYDLKDDDHPALVEECIWMSRREDAEIPFIGGIYMGDADIADNPMRHRGCKDEPKYDVVPFGYHRINEHFFYYKSMMNEVGWDDQLIDAQYELIMNRGLLDVNMPLAVSGVDTDSVSSDMVFPSAVVAFKNDNAKVTPLLPASNMAASLSAMHETERSMSEFGVSETMDGSLPAASQKAHTVAVANANAKVLISAVGKSLGNSVAEYGALMVDIAVRHVTVPEVDELLGSGMAKLRYHQFTVDAKGKGGRRGSKKVKFDPSLIGASMTDEEKDTRSLKLLEESGYPEESTSIIVANPEAFSRMKYLVRVDPTELFAKNEEYHQALWANIYTQLRQDPLIDPATLVRKYTYAYLKGDGEDLLAKQGDNIAAVLGQPQQQPESPLGSMAKNKALSTGTGGQLSA